MRPETDSGDFVGQAVPPHLPQVTANTQVSREGDSRAHQPRGLTWGGGLVDDVVAILLGNNGVAHGQEGEELLYARSCGLETAP